MIPHFFSRTELLIGTEGLKKLKNSKIAIFGIGGVGSFVAEALARSGIYSIVLIDDDSICPTNINRQIHALAGTIGKPKVEVMKARILDINPKAKVTVYKQFFSSENAEKLLFADYDYVIDAIDTVSSKIDLIEKCKKRNIPIISAMGAANKLDPTKLEVSDIYNTSVCPLARVMRKQLRKRRIRDLKVVYSKERPITLTDTDGTNRTDTIGTNCTTDTSGTNRGKDYAPYRNETHMGGHRILGSISFVPSVAGLIMAAEVVRDLVGI